MSFEDHSAWPIGMGRDALEECAADTPTSVYMQGGVILAVSQRRSLSDLDADNYDRYRDDRAEGWA